MNNNFFVLVLQSSCKPLSVICVVVFIVNKSFAESTFLAGGISPLLPSGD